MSASMVDNSTVNPGHRGGKDTLLYTIAAIISLAYFALQTQTIRKTLSINTSTISLRRMDGLSDTTATIHYVSTKETSARCLDGSPPAYYLRPGSGTGHDKWVIFFEGGGWCYDPEQCYLRSKTHLGSSVAYPKFMLSGDMHFYISGRHKENPMMHNWNTVYVRYCDGSSFAGDSLHYYQDKPIHFQGRANRDETIRSLLQKDGMDAAAEVVIIGCSAGGLGIFLGIDQMANIIRTGVKPELKETVIIRGVSDSGFFMKYTSDTPVTLTHHAYGKDEAYNLGHMDYQTSMRDIFAYMNISSGTDKDCILAANMADTLEQQLSLKSDCIFAEHVVPHVQTPTFLIQPRFDQWQILHIYSHTYTDEGVNEYGKKLVATIQDKLFHKSHPGHGAFIDSCTHHCTSCSHRGENSWSGGRIISSKVSEISSSSSSSSSNASRSDGDIGTGIDGPSLTPADAFHVWYAQSTGRSLSAILPVPVGGVDNIAAPKGHLGGHNGNITGEKEWEEAPTDVPLLEKMIPVGSNWFIQDQPYPCASCCLCDVEMKKKLPH